MKSSITEVLRDQGRGVAGALLVVGLSFVYTMETWWLGWRLPLAYLAAYSVLGLVVISSITRYVGFRDEDRPESVRQRAADFAELLVQSFVTAYGALLLFGVLELGDPLGNVVRLGLIQLIPLSFGAALANAVLAQSSEERAKNVQFPRNLTHFGLGAAFVTFPIAPTQEMELVAAHAGWWRLSLAVVVSLLVAHLVLYELEFRGQQNRVEPRSKPLQWGETFVVYVVALVVSFALLASFGHFVQVPPAVWIQETVVLAFPASVGASAGAVVL